MKKQKPAHFKLLEDLVKGKKISSEKLASYGASNPNDLIYKLRKLGVNIDTVRTPTTFLYKLGPNNE